MADIQSMGTWKNNSEMIADVALLGFIPGNVLDLTYGDGAFWNHFRPADLTTNDLDPEKPAEHHQDFRCTTWESGSFTTVVFDPPYKMQGTPSSEAMDSHFGTDVVRTRPEVLSLIVGGVAEGSRLATKFLLVKCMDQVSSGKARWQTQVVTDTARALEWRWVDQFLLPGGRPQPKGRSQKHARHEYSTLLVFGRR
jgi:hypothetical protein